MLLLHTSVICCEWPLTDMTRMVHYACNACITVSPAGAASLLWQWPDQLELPRLWLQQTEQQLL